MTSFGRGRRLDGGTAAGPSVFSCARGDGTVPSADRSDTPSANGTSADGTSWEVPLRAVGSAEAATRSRWGVSVPGGPSRCGRSASGDEASGTGTSDRDPAASGRGGGEPTSPGVAGSASPVGEAVRSSSVRSSTAASEESGPIRPANSTATRCKLSRRTSSSRTRSMMRSNISTNARSNVDDMAFLPNWG